MRQLQRRKLALWRFPNLRLRHAFAQWAGLRTLVLVFAGADERERGGEAVLRRPYVGGKTFKVDAATTAASLFKLRAMRRRREAATHDDA